jgi:hypothetical protein
MNSVFLRTVLRHVASCMVVGGVLAAGVHGANAQAQMTCADTAHAYACCQLSSLPAAEFLKSCVQERLKALGSSARAAERANRRPLSIQ